MHRYSLPPLHVSLFHIRKVQFSPEGEVKVLETTSVPGTGSELPHWNTGTLPISMSAPARQVQSLCLSVNLLFFVRQEAGER